MPIRKHIRDDQAAGPRPADAPADSGNVVDGQPMPEDSAESDGEQQAREAERGLDRALTRIPPG